MSTSITLLGHARTDTAVRSLATAVLALRAALHEMEDVAHDGATAALTLGLLEQANRAVGFGQLQMSFTAEILDMGREVRSFTNAQRKALAIRDRGCVYPGCSRPAATTEAHHVKPWSEGGETNVGNCACVCLHHHLMLHAGLFKLEMINGIPYVTEHAGQPRGDPERNLYWHPELRTQGFTTPLFDA